MISNDPTVTDPDRRSVPPSATRRFGRYEIQATLGQGGMGEVLKAWDPTFKRLVALKRILPGIAGDPTQLGRFEREARAAARLSHPSIVAVYDVGVEEGRPYLATEFVEGETLAAVLRSRRRFEVETAVGLVRRIAEALQHAHERGVVHRDVKPSNVLVGTDGRVRVADFGLAKLLDSEVDPALTASGALLGTPRYMSPEQAEGRTREVGPATDQFSLAVILHELLTGEQAFGGGSVREVLNAICDRELPSVRERNDAVGPALEAVLRRALEKDPARRYPSMGEFGADLGRAEAPAPPTGWRPWRVALAACAALAVAALSWTFARGRRDDPPPVADVTGEDDLDRATEALEAALRSRRSGGDLDASREEIEAASKALERSTSARGRLALGRARAALGRLDLAEESLRSALALDPGLAEAGLELGRGLATRAWLAMIADAPLPLAARRPSLERLAAEAVAAVDAASGRDRPEWGLTLGVLAWVRSDAQGLFLYAAEGLERWAGDEGEADFRFLAGLAASGAEAVLSFDLALERTPDHVLSLVARGRARDHQGDAPGALADLDRAIALAPGSAALRELRARLRLASGEVLGAVADHDEAIALEPADPMPWFTRGWIRHARLGDLDGAIEDYRRATGLAPDFVTPWYDLAVAWSARGDRLAASGRREEAAADWTAAAHAQGERIRIEPGNSGARIERGRLREKLGDRDAAAAAYEEAISVAPVAEERRLAGELLEAVRGR